MTDNEALFKNAMVGAKFTGFKFHTGFSLRFDGKKGVVVHLDLDGSWRIGTVHEWAALVEAIPLRSVESDEPAQAASLAFMRWNEDCTVVDVRLVGLDLSIQFASGKSLTTVVGTLSGGGTEWSLVHIDGRSIWCEDGRIATAG